MELETESQVHAEQGKDSAPTPVPTRKPSRLIRWLSNIGHVDSRTLVYVLLIIAACALVIVAIAAVSQTILATPSMASSFSKSH